MSVNKSNELIQRASHDLDSIKLKLLNKIIEKIDSEAKEFKQFYYLDLNSFVKDDLGYKDDKNITHIYKKLKEMRDKGFEIISEEIKELSGEQKELVSSLLASKKLSIKEVADITKFPLYQIINYLKILDLTKKIKEEINILEKENIVPEDAIKTIETYSGWFSGIEKVSTTNIIKIEIPRMMEKFYLDLVNKGYTSVNAKLIYKLKSKYSIRFYELITSHSHKQKKIQNKTKDNIIYEDYIEVTIPYKKLRTMLKIDIKRYKDYRNFRIKVLEKAKMELKEKNTDIQFDYEASGRGPGKDIIFKIYNIKEMQENEAEKKKQELLSSGDNIDQQIYTDIEKALKDGGVSKTVRNSLISNFDEMRIRRNIELQYKRLANKKITRKELPGALVKSIKDDWAMGTYEDNKERIQNDENNKNTFDKPLPILTDETVTTLEKQKESLKKDNNLYQEFIKFMAQIAKDKPTGRASTILPQIMLDVNSIETIPFIDKFIDKFFQMRLNN